MYRWYNCSSYLARRQARAALVVALAHLHGATSLHDENGKLAHGVLDTRRSLALDRDLIDRIEPDLARVLFDDFVREARERLNP